MRTENTDTKVYFRLARRAARFECSRDYAFAENLWREAARACVSTQHREWCEKRADFCEYRNRHKNIQEGEP